MSNSINAGDTAWVLLSSALVFLMSPGLSFFYTGLVRKKNALNTLMMTCVAMAIGTIVWLSLGYSLAFAQGSAWLGSLQWAGFQGVGEDACAYAPSVPHLAFAAFQGMFAAITPAIISGAIVERMNFRAYVLFLTLWSALVYAPVAHWVWSADGWIHKLGALDFAGGTVVHISAGCAALVCALVLGPRTDHRRIPLIPHNVPFVLLGAGLLWFGWFGFNGGSALAANGLAGLAFVNTNFAACGAMLTWLVSECIRSGKPTAVGAATGSVVGLVAVTPAAGFVSPGAALAIGVISAVVCFAALQLRTRSDLDDTLDVFACHGVGGICGALLTGCFATLAVNECGANGLLSGNAALLGTQLVAVSATILYVCLASVVLLKLVGVVIPLRVELRAELEGLDRHAHGEEAYHDSQAIGALGKAVLFTFDAKDSPAGNVLSKGPRAHPDLIGSPAKNPT